MKIDNFHFDLHRTSLSNVVYVNEQLINEHYEWHKNNLVLKGCGFGHLQVNYNTIAKAIGLGSDFSSGCAKLEPGGRRHNETFELNVLLKFTSCAF